MSDQPTKQVTAYCEPWSLRAGERIRLMASSLTPCAAELDLVQIICGDPSRSGPGFEEREVPSTLPRSIALETQVLTPGSYATVDLSGITHNQKVVLTLHLMPTAPELDQPIVQLSPASGTAIDLSMSAQHLVLNVGAQQFTLSQRTLVKSRWYAVSVTLEQSSFTASISACGSRAPGFDYFDSDAAQASGGTFDAQLPDEFQVGRFAASATGGRFDGRIARPRLHLGEQALSWDLTTAMDSAEIRDTGPLQRHAKVFQLPARAVTGPAWDSSSQDWRARPDHYDAIHFHSDDLYDAGWDTTAELELPADLPSGIYAFRIRGDGGDDRVPFFVRPAEDKNTNDVALLMSSCTYMAYANHRMLFEGADFVAARARLRPEHAYIRDHRELGVSCYEKHSDGSGVMFSSRRRPVLQVRPGADGWNFTPDTVINAFLEHLEVGHDVISDEDVHFEGIDALSPYRVIVTGSHPEYWSTAMLDALETWQRNGGRLLYLGGNGFYWRVAFSNDWPGAIELRRAEDGVRNWQCEPGEYYHAFGGEYGGLWRRLGRPPNQIAGVGFTAQGFERATFFERTPASHDSRASWIFEGVENEKIGTSGLGGGAAGQEIDRFDAALGSPPHAVILATATEFGPDMVRVKEEFEGSVFLSPDDPLVRADVVFYETQNGGAVFSVGSISWFGALARENYSNDVARITANVIRRFIDPVPFPEQENASRSSE